MDEVVSAYPVGDAPSTLATRLAEAAAVAEQAAIHADGAYIPQMSRRDELQLAVREAAGAIALLVRLQPSLRMLDGGAVAQLIARSVITELEAGCRELRDASMSPTVRAWSDARAEEPLAVGAARLRFRDARERLLGIADLARLEATDAADLPGCIIGS